VVCGSVLQCAAACYILLQYVAVRYSVCCNALQRMDARLELQRMLCLQKVCCSAFKCVAVRCNV